MVAGMVCWGTKAGRKEEIAVCPTRGVCRNSMGQAKAGSVCVPARHRQEGEIKNPRQGGQKGAVWAGGSPAGQSSWATQVLFHRSQQGKEGQAWEEQKKAWHVTNPGRQVGRGGGVAGAVHGGRCGATGKGV